MYVKYMYPKIQYQIYWVTQNKYMKTVHYFFCYSYTFDYSRKSQISHLVKWFSTISALQEISRDYSYVSPYFAIWHIIFSKPNINMYNCKMCMGIIFVMYIYIYRIYVYSMQFRKGLQYLKLL